MDPFKYESWRLKSFGVEWKSSNSMADKNILAKTGFFYSGETDKIKCYFCNIVLECSSIIDDLLIGHLSYSPHCPLLNLKVTDNEPIDSESLQKALERIIKSEEEEEEEQNMKTEYEKREKKPVTYPAHGDYIEKIDRIESFKYLLDYRIHSLAEELGDAGFFYSLKDDEIACFSCGIVLNAWKCVIDAWQFHIIKTKYCPFLLRRRGDNYIETVREIYKRKKSKTRKMDNYFKDTSLENMYIFSPLYTYDNNDDDENDDLNVVSSTTEI